VCPGTSLEKADYIIASSGKFREPKVTSGIGSGCAEIGDKAFFGQQLGQNISKAVN
jgi:hypothetical protein